VIPDDIVEKVLGVVSHRVEVVLQVSPRVLYHAPHNVLSQHPLAALLETGVQ
jgi:hypothetical protein